MAPWLQAARRRRFYTASTSRISSWGMFVYCLGSASGGRVKDIITKLLMRVKKIEALSKKSWQRNLSIYDGGLRINCGAESLQWWETGRSKKFLCRSLLQEHLRNLAPGFSDLGRISSNEMHGGGDIISFGNGWANRVNVRLQGEVGGLWYTLCRTESSHPVASHTTLSSYPVVSQ